MLNSIKLNISTGGNRDKILPKKETARSGPNLNQVLKIIKHQRYDSEIEEKMIAKARQTPHGALQSFVDRMPQILSKLKSERKA